MRYLIVLLALLTGCGQPFVKPDVVEVKVPVAYIPVPPDVPKIDYQVDKLTEQDKKNPGKVVQAYVYDMKYLRAVVEMYEEILDTYRQSSGDFKEIQKKLDMIQPTNPAVVQ